MNKINKIIDDMVHDIENEEINYIELCGSYDFWEEGVHIAMLHVKVELPFNQSFDDYDSEWFEKNKHDVVQWLKALSDGMKDFPVLVDDDDLQKNSLEFLKNKYPDAKVVHENPHSGEFSVTHPDGTYYYCGFNNGDLSCDIYESQEGVDDGDVKGSLQLALFAEETEDVDGVQTEFNMADTYQPFDLLRLSKDAFYEVIEEQFSAENENRDFSVHEAELEFVAEDTHNVFIRVKVLDYTLND